jgi:hypothetical protein
MKKFLIISLILIALIHIPGTIYKWYYKIWWLDILMHIFGGFWVGLLFLYIIEKNYDLKNFLFNTNKNIVFLIILTLGFIALIGVLWEFYEFFMDVIILKKYIYNAEPGYILFDTLKDLFNDLIGGLISLTIYLKKSKNNLQ